MTANKKWRPAENGACTLVKLHGKETSFGFVISTLSMNYLET